MFEIKKNYIKVFVTVYYSSVHYLFFFNKILNHVDMHSNILNLKQQEFVFDIQYFKKKII